jgi:hypothetical protein
VRDYLEDVALVSRERMFLIAPKLNADGIKDKGAPNRVDFSLSNLISDFRHRFL